MIPTESLAVDSALRWIGVSLVGLFLFAVFVITVGDALYRRLQRNQLKRELKKISIPLVAISLSISLLTSQLAFGQAAASPPQKATPEVQYHRLFKAVNLLVVRLKDVCKTEECAALVTEGTALIADAQEKQKKGSLVNDERQQFHKNLDSLLIRVKTALVAVDAKQDNGAARLQIPQGLACPAGKPGVKTIVYDQDRCDLCYQVFETAAEICALYLGICETCSLICLSVAILQFGHCIQEFCNGT
jgi:hypothetical protein